MAERTTQKAVLSIIRPHGANMKLFLVVLALSAMPVMAANTQRSPVISATPAAEPNTTRAPRMRPASRSALTAEPSRSLLMTQRKTVYTIDDPDSVKDHYGHHVSVVAKVDDSAKTIHISKVTMLPDQGTRPARRRCTKPSSFRLPCGGVSASLDTARPSPSPGFPACTVLFGSFFCVHLAACGKMSQQPSFC